MICRCARLQAEVATLREESIQLLPPCDLCGLDPTASRERLPLGIPAQRNATSL